MFKLTLESNLTTQKGTQLFEKLCAFFMLRCAGLAS